MIILIFHQQVGLTVQANLNLGEYVVKRVKASGTDFCQMKQTAQILWARKRFDFLIVENRKKINQVGYVDTQNWIVDARRRLFP